MIKNIIFDLGNVLLSFKPMEFLLRYTEDFERIKIFVSKVTGSKTWLQLDRGLISIETAKNLLFTQHAEETDLLIPFFEHWMEMLIPIKNIIEILKRLKQNGYKIYALSNFIKEAFNYVKNRYNFFSLFDGQVISCEEKVIKPEKAIYEILIRRYNLIPKECVFLDDYPSFLEPAEQMGMNTILVHPNVDLQVEFEKLKIII